MCPSPTPTLLSGDHRLSISCAVVEQPDHHCGDDLVLFYHDCRKNKVITAMVIRPPDDRTYCVRCAFTHLDLWRKLYNCSWHYFTANVLY